MIMQQSFLYLADSIRATQSGLTIEEGQVSCQINFQDFAPTTAPLLQLLLCYHDIPSVYAAAIQLLPSCLPPLDAHGGISHFLGRE